MIVHPPPPVLDATRGTMLRFARALRARVREAGGRGEWRHADTGARLLHFVDVGLAALFRAPGAAAADLDALPPSSLRLRPDLDLDGTHLSPAYLRVLQTALDAIGAEGAG